MIKIYLFLATVLIVGCNTSLFGTNTGNPESNTTSPIVNYEGALKLGYQVCNKIKDCYPGSAVSDCMNHIATFNNYTSELGATAGAYATLTSLRNAEINNQVTPDQTNFTSCEQAIQALSCSDPLVQNGYSVSAPSEYGLTNILFRSSNSCALIY